MELTFVSSSLSRCCLLLRTHYFLIILRWLIVYNDLSWCGLLLLYLRWWLLKLILSLSAILCSINFKTDYMLITVLSSHRLDMITDIRLSTRVFFLAAVLSCILNRFCIWVLSTIGNWWYWITVLSTTGLWKSWSWVLGSKCFWLFTVLGCMRDREFLSAVLSTHCHCFLLITILSSHISRILSLASFKSYL